MDTITERVAKGAALLDREYPDWWQIIDLDALALASPCRCVLGQVYAHEVEPGGDGEDYEDGYDYAINQVPDLASHDEHYGFDDDPESGVTYSELTAEWRRVIEARRSA